jgi:hypothetical protein
MVDQGNKNEIGTGTYPVIESYPILHKNINWSTKVNSTPPEKN